MVLMMFRVMGKVGFSELSIRFLDALPRMKKATNLGFRYP